VSKEDALVMALRAEKHERGTKTMTAPQPSEGRRRAQTNVAVDCKLSERKKRSHERIAAN